MGYLEEGDNRVKVVLIFINRHVLKCRVSIRKTSVVSPKENSHSNWCSIDSFSTITLRENLVQNLHSPPRIVPTVPSYHHINLIIKNCTKIALTQYRETEKWITTKQSNTLSHLTFVIPCERNGWREKHPSLRCQKTPQWWNHRKDKSSASSRRIPGLRWVSLERSNLKLLIYYSRVACVCKTCSAGMKEIQIRETLLLLCCYYVRRLSLLALDIKLQFLIRVKKAAIF